MAPSRTARTTVCARQGAMVGRCVLTVQHADYSAGLTVACNLILGDSNLGYSKIRKTSFPVLPPLHLVRAG